MRALHMHCCCHMWAVHPNLDAAAGTAVSRSGVCTEAAVGARAPQHWLSTLHPQCMHQHYVGPGHSHALLQVRCCGCLDCCPACFQAAVGDMQQQGSSCSSCDVSVMHGRYPVWPRTHTLDLGVVGLTLTAFACTFSFSVMIPPLQWIRQCWGSSSSSTLQDKCDVAVGCAVLTL